MALTDAGEQFVLDQLMTGAYISLHTGVASPGNEVGAGVNYNRIAYGAYTFTVGNPSTVSNDVLIEFPTASGLWGLIQEFGVWTAATGGEMRVTGAIPTPKEVDIGDVVRFLPTTLVVTAK